MMLVFKPSPIALSVVRSTARGRASRTAMTFSDTVRSDSRQTIDRRFLRGYLQGEQQACDVLIGAVHLSACCSSGCPLRSLYYLIDVNTVLVHAVCTIAYFQIQAQCFDRAQYQ